MRSARNSASISGARAEASALVTTDRCAGVPSLIGSLAGELARAARGVREDAALLEVGRRPGALAAVAERDPGRAVLQGASSRSG